MRFFYDDSFTLIVRRFLRYEKLALDTVHHHRRFNTLGRSDGALGLKGGSGFDGLEFEGPVVHNVIGGVGQADFTFCQDVECVRFLADAHDPAAAFHSFVFAQSS